MFIRYNEAAKYYEYDTSAGQTGAGPWVILPISSASIVGPGGTPTNVAYTNVVNQFKFNQRISNELGDHPRLTFKNVNLGPDVKVWQILNIDDNLSFWALNDAESSVMGQWTINRAGTLVAGLVPSDRLSANVALTDKSNIFQLNQTMIAVLQMQGAHIFWYRPDGPGDSRMWHQLQDASGSLTLYPVNDAQNTVQNPGFAFRRDGTFVVSSGVAFPSTQIQVASPNVLDDYEEGSWTPYLFSNTGGSSIPLTAIGKYTKIGQFVHCQYEFAMQGASWADGYLYLAGLPFQPVNDGVLNSGTVVQFGGLVLSVLSLTPHIYSGINYGHINYKDKVSTSNDGALVTSHVAANFTISGLISFRVTT